MVIFIELVQYAKSLGGKSRKNLVEHQIIKNLIASFVVFSHSIVKITYSVCYVGPYRLTIQMMLLNFLIIFYYLILHQKLLLVFFLLRKYGLLF